MASDLISRSALMSMHYDMKYTEVKGEVFVRLEDVVSWIKSIPTVDAVEVVRCKDCKFYRNEIGLDLYEGYCKVRGIFNSDDDYCSVGAKMDGG